MTTPDNVSSFRPGGPGKISKTLVHLHPVSQTPDMLAEWRRKLLDRTRTCGAHICRDQRPGRCGQTYYGTMISVEDGDDFYEADEHYATDTTWSWVKRFVDCLHDVWKKKKKTKHALWMKESTWWWGQQLTITVIIDSSADRFQGYL